MLPLAPGQVGIDARENEERPALKDSLPRFAVAPIRFAIDPAAVFQVGGKNLACFSSQFGIRASTS